MNWISSQIIFYTNLWVRLSLNIIQLIYHKHMVKISLLDLKLLKFAGDKLPPGSKYAGDVNFFFSTFLSPYKRLIPILAFHNISTSIIKFILLIFISLFLSSNTHTNTNIYIIFAQDLKWSQSVELMDSSSMQKKKKVDVWKRRLIFAWPAHLSSVIGLLIWHRKLDLKQYFPSLYIISPQTLVV